MWHPFRHSWSFFVIFSWFSSSSSCCLYYNHFLNTHSHTNRHWNESLHSSLLSCSLPTCSDISCPNIFPLSCPLSFSFSYLSLSTSPPPPFPYSLYLSLKATSSPSLLLSCNLFCLSSSGNSRPSPSPSLVSFKPPPPRHKYPLPLSQIFLCSSWFLPTFFCLHIFSSPSLLPPSHLSESAGQPFCLKVTQSIWSCCRDTWSNLFAGGRCEETGLRPSGVSRRCSRQPCQGFCLLFIYMYG